MAFQFCEQLWKGVSCGFTGLGGSPDRERTDFHACSRPSVPFMAESTTTSLYCRPTGANSSIRIDSHFLKAESRTLGGRQPVPSHFQFTTAPFSTCFRRSNSLK